MPAGLIKKIARRISFMRDPVGFHRRQGVRIGKRVELIGASPQTFGSEPYLVQVGDDVTISGGVEFVTHDGGLRVIRDTHPHAYYYAPITVGNHVFIGTRALILPGVTIGDRAVVGAGALVTRDVAAGMVVAGVPARPMKSVEDYAFARRDQWVNTGGLNDVEKEKVLRRWFSDRNRHDQQLDTPNGRSPARDEVRRLA